MRWWNSNWRKRLVVVTAMLSIALMLGIGFTSNQAAAGVPAQAAPKAVGSGASAAAPDEKPASSAPFNCADVSRLGIDKQMNMHAAQILAACAGKTLPGGQDAVNPGGGSDNNHTGDIGKKFVQPLAFGGTDADVVLPDATYPKVTQSEAMVWGHGNTIVVNYNDSRTSSGCYAGNSYSTNGGTTWTAGQSFCSGHGTNYGDPIVVWNNALNLWFAGDLATGCGGQGIGMWTSPNGITWTAGACAHNSSSDDRESMWVDNNPASPHYGRMYISFADYTQTGPPLEVVYSDNGTTWTTVFASPAGTFIRDVQITGDLLGSGNVYIAGMDEGGGGLANRINHMFVSTNGGATWTDHVMGPAFYPPGRAVSGYFAGMYAGGYWRHMGWGQPAAVGNVVHYTYAMGISGTDPGNVMYTRSTDAGNTWSAPIQLNTDSTTRAQWQPSLAATAAGGVFVGWYDERETTAANCVAGATTLCYRRYGRVSLNNGVSWQADDTVGDVISPLPGQPDSAVQSLYAGDYNYASSDGNNVYDTWTDGRTIISGASQQDVLFDKINVIVGTPTPTNTPCSPIPCTNTPTNTPSNTFTNTPTPTFTNTPTATPTISTCGTNSNYTYTTGNLPLVPGTTDIGNHCDDCITNIVLPFAFSLYGVSYTSANVSSNGTFQFTSSNTNYSNICLPDATMQNTIFPFWDDGYTTDTASGEGIFTSISGSAPNRIFNVEWRAVYCCTGGAPILDYELRLYENPAPYVSRFDVVYGSPMQDRLSATVGVQNGTGAGGYFTQYVCNTAVSPNTSVTFTQAPCGTPTFTPTGTPPTATPTFTLTNTPTRTVTPTFTLTPTPTATVCSNYSVAVAAATIVPGVTDIGNHSDDADTLVALPFPYQLYSNTYNSVNVSSNGRLDFAAVNDPGGYANTCLPAGSSFDYTVFPFWDDLYLVNSGYGVFTSVSGSAPNRIFNIEWRAQHYPGTGSENFEVRLYEGQQRFDVVYGSLDDAGVSATVGIQGVGTAGFFTQYECNTGGLTNGMALIFTLPQCGTPGPTGTPTNTPTITPTPCGVAAGWYPGPNFPAVGQVRGLGVYFPPNGNFYVLGGRTSDAVGSDLMNPSQYNPSTNTWTVKSAVFDDNQVNNMVGGVLNVGGTNYIYTVGGSAAGATTATGTVRRYNPVADTITVISTDPWPGNTGGTVLPGGAAVVGNKLYVFGGFNINVSVTNQIWQFDPNAAAGSMWTLKGSVLPVGEGYIPTTAIGSLIYMAGGSGYSGGTLVDTNNSYVYNPATDVISTIATITRATAETRAVTVNGEMWVLGGGRTLPNPSNEVDIYNVGTNSWRLGTPFNTVRRNFPADSDGSTVWLVGGYASDGLTALNTMEIYRQAVPCQTPTPTPGVVLVGHVTYQGIPQPNARNQQPITLTLCVGGSPQNNVTTTDTTGHFTVTLALSPGNYSSKAKDYKNLSNAQPLTLTLGINNVEFGTLKAGDANNNDLINTADFTLLKNNFGSSTSPNTDFNNDGVTNTTDFTLQKGNFGLVGGAGYTCP